MLASNLKLISSKTCPYVQRAAIVLHEKSVPFEIIYIDQNNKPDWFLSISPLGKVPVLKVDDIVLFESSVIAEYLDEVYLPMLHPSDALQRAINRAWIEFSSTILTAQLKMLLSPDRVAFDMAAQHLQVLLDRLEEEAGAGPFFNGEKLALVDCAFAPFFLRTTIMEPYLKLGAFSQRPHIETWSKALLARDSVQRSVVPHYAKVLIDSWRTRAPLGRELFSGHGS